MKEFVETSEIRKQIVTLGRQIAEERKATLCGHDFDFKNKYIILLLKDNTTHEVYTWPVLFKDIKITIKETK